MGVSGNPVLYFDGVCNLCNRIVQFFIRHDRKGILQYASLQSGAGRVALAEVRKREKGTIDSVLLYHKGVYYVRSDAAIRALMLLGRGWKLSAVMLVMPRVIRDGLYKWVSRNRYRWFGKRNECMVPTPELRSRFLQD